MQTTEVAQLREAASHLSEADRAELAVFLLDSLDGAPHWVDDEEVVRRSEELDSGEVQPLTLAEFKAACGR